MDSEWTRVQLANYQKALEEIAGHICNCYGNQCTVCIARKALGLPLRNKKEQEQE